MLCLCFEGECLWLVVTRRCYKYLEARASAGISFTAAHWHVASRLAESATATGAGTSAAGNAALLAGFSAALANLLPSAASHGGGAARLRPGGRHGASGSGHNTPLGLVLQPDAIIAAIREDASFAAPLLRHLPEGQQTAERLVEIVSGAGAQRSLGRASCSLPHPHPLLPAAAAAAPLPAAAPGRGCPLSSDGHGQRGVGLRKLWAAAV